LSNFFDFYSENELMEFSGGDIIERIKLKLGNDKFYQKTLAERLGRDKQIVSVWFKNKKVPKAEVLYEIAQKLDTTVEFLMAGKREEAMTDDEADLVRIYREADTEQRILILGNARLVAGIREAPEKEMSASKKAAG
jgi:transcriptional regulator with XRE-family HTH domain